jgi:hypothetical protein
MPHHHGVLWRCGMSLVVGAGQAKAMRLDWTLNMIVAFWI